MSQSHQSHTIHIADLVRRAAAIFLPSVLVSWGAIYFFYAMQAGQTQDQLVHAETRFLETLSRAVGGDLDSAVSDVLVLGRYEPLLRLLETPTARERAVLGRAFRDFAARKKVFDQVRFLDGNGREVVRVNRTPGGAAVVPDAELQDKSDRYYFTEAVSLPRDGVYVSPLDLNIEGDAVELPHKPMIRLATPVFDGQGARRGVVVLNYLAELLLEDIRRMSEHSAGRVYLLNAEGYWLIGRTPEEEWGFMFAGREGRTFQSAFPEAWDSMQASEAGCVRAPGGIFVYARVAPLPGMSHWIAVSHLDRQALEAGRAPLLRIALLTGGLLSAFLLAGALFVAQAQLRRRAALEEAMRLREREREEQFRTLADNISQLAWMADEHGRIFWLNKRWDDYTGAAPEAAYGTGWQAFLHPDHAGRVAEQVGRAVETGEAWEDTFPVRGRDGEYRWFLSRAIPVRNGLGRVMRWFGTGTDVTGQRAMMEELAQAREAAEAASRVKSEFLANMSHEIRTPMNGVLGMNELALMTTDDPKVREYLLIAKRSGQALLDIVNDILDLSKIEADKVELEREPFALRTLLEETLQPLRAAALAKGVALLGSIDPGVPDMLVGDRGRLRQILTNIVGNGVKFTEAGAVTVSVGLDEAPSASSARLLFTVRDDGIGIPAGKLSVIFDAFSQVGGSAHVKYGGTGLGLAISRQLVELMDGRIWADSQEGRGSTFRFTASFGLAREADTPAPAVPPGPERSGQGLRVLLVEDNLINQLLAVELLERRGHEARTAENGREALESLRASAFDLVLMDVRMPVMDGLEATRRIRAGEAGNPRVPIVALTAHALREDRERILLAGMDDSLSKPVDMEALDRVLARILEGRAGEERTGR